jgi:hypothetical protein
MVEFARWPDRFETAALTSSNANQAGDLHVLLPKWLATEIFDMPLVPVHGALRVPMEQSWAIEEMT